MPTKLKRRPREVCPRKKVYRSRRAALAAIDSIRRAGGFADPLSPYRCPQCDQWHVGHRAGWSASLRRGRDE
jgi:hypothetical protein